MSEAITRGQYTSPVLVEEADERDLARQITILASMHSFLEKLGLRAEDIRGHLYDLLAIWVSRAPYTYIEGLIELCSYKEREISHLVDLYGEEGLELMLSSLESDVCEPKEEMQTLHLLMNDLGVAEPVRAKIIEKARKAGCWGIRSASIALLITPAQG